MSAIKTHIIMETPEVIEQPKKKGKFWKVLLKVVTIGLVVSKVWVKDERIKETAGEILEKLPDNK